MGGTDKAPTACPLWQTAHISKDKHHPFKQKHDKFPPDIQIEHVQKLSACLQACLSFGKTTHNQL